MSLNPAELEAAVRRGDAPAVRELLRDATEAERAACAKALKQFLKGPEWSEPDLVMLRPQQFMQFMASGFQDMPPALAEQQRQQRERNAGYDAWREIANGLAFQLAALGLAGGVAAAATLAQDFPGYCYPRVGSRTVQDIELIARVLADRKPGWLADFMNRHLRLQGQYPLGIDAWPLARTLVRLGAIPRPDAAQYTTLMPAQMRLAPSDYLDARPRTPAELTHALLADPGLLEEEVWRLFTVPDAAPALERAGCWAQGLVRLSADGVLDRDRLLGACLAAFTRDFHPNRVSWYAELLENLEPTDVEIAARAATYLGLLAASSKVGITVGQQGLTRILAAGQLDTDQFLAASASALLFKQKSIVTAQLRLIEKAVALQPATAPDAAAAVAVAFGHERQDIQEAALKLIRRLGVPAGEQFATIRLHAADLSPALAPEAVALGLLGAPAEPVPDEELPALPIQAEIEERIRVLPPTKAEDLIWALTVAQAGEVPGPVPVEPEAGALLSAPVTDPDELVQLFAMLIEDARDALAAERALAGAVRLSSLPREQRARIAAPLLKRVQEVMHHYPFSGNLITSDIALVAYAWAGEELPDVDGSREHDSWQPEKFAVSGSGQALTVAGIFSARAWEAARLAGAGQGGLLLAEPETERGAISAATLLDRVRELSRRRKPVCRQDLDVALLRLALEPAGALWNELAQLTGRPAAALQETDRLVRLPVSFEAVTGEPSGQPFRHSQHWHVHLLARTVGAVPATPGNRCWQLLTALTDPLADHHVLYGPSRYFLRHYDAAVAAWPLICPWQPEVASAHLLRPLSDGLIPGLTPATTAIQGIQHPGHPLGPVGHLALVTGLSGDAGDARIAAAQLWSDACADGRLDPKLAARAIVTGAAGEALKVSRIADSLRHASHTPLSAYRIVETVIAATDGFAPDYPAAMHALLELAAQLATRVGAAELPAAVPELAARRGSTRLVTTARQLAAAARGPAPERPQVIEQALAAHLLRAPVTRAGPD
jgi:uncharacterized protein DUF6493